MKSIRILCPALLLALVISFAGCGATPQAPANAGDVQATLDALCGPEMKGRKAGTAENAKAGEYINQVFGALGLEALFDGSFAAPYEQDICDDIKADPRLTAHFADGTTRELVYGSEFNFRVSCGVVDVKLDVTESLDAPDIENKIFISGKDINYSELNASTARFVVVPRENAIVVVQGASQTEKTSISIDENVLDALLEKGITAFSIKCAESLERITLNNYIGVIKGKDSSKAAIIGAHFDGAGANGDIYSAGAVDNASGVATMLNIAKLLSADAKPEIDIVFCAFNGEETHLQGSTAAALQLAALYDECYYINIDCVGYKGIDTYMYFTGYANPLAEAFKPALEDGGFTASENGAAGSDWAPFYEAGISSLCLYHEIEGAINHTTDDRPDKLDPKIIERLAQVVAGFVRDSAGNTYRDDHEDEYSAEMAVLKKAIAKKAEVLAGLGGLAYNQRYMYELDGFKVSVSGNHPVQSADALREIYPWVDVLEALGTYKLKEVLGIDIQTNIPLSVSDGEYSIQVGPDRDGVIISPMPLNQVITLNPGAADQYYFVYENASGNCVQIIVYPRTEEQWQKYGANSTPLADVVGEQADNFYCQPYGENNDIYTLSYYSGAGFELTIRELDTATQEDSAYGNYECNTKPLTPDEAMQLIRDMGLGQLDDYFTSLLRDPDGD